MSTSLTLNASLESVLQEITFDHLSSSSVYLHSVANVIDDETFYTKMTDAASEIASRLRVHCGPFAANAVIPSPMGGSGTTIDQYTKDGISIVKAWRTNDVTVEYLKRLTAYIGERVDQSCHDGTTTSMMLFTILVKYLFTVIPDDVFLSSNLSKLAKSMQTSLNQMRSVITKNTKTMESLTKALSTKIPDVTLTDVKKAVAYQQSLIASKGDRELAYAISEVLSLIPVELYGQYIVRTSQFETATRYLIDEQPYHIELTSNILIADKNNHALGTEFLAEDCDLMICYAPLISGNPNTDALIALFDPSNEDRGFYGLPVGETTITRPLVLLATEIKDSRILGLINTHNVINKDAPIIPFNYQTSTTIRQMYSLGLSAMAFKPDLSLALETTGNPTDCIIPHVKIHHRRSTMMLYNLYEKTDSIYHPGYEDPTLNTLYTTTLTELKTIIDNITKKHISTLSDRDLLEAITLFRTMSCQKIVDIKLGSTTHDIIANRSVVEDAMGSAVSALSDGVVFGGHLAMFNEATHMVKASTTVVDSTANMCLSYSLAQVLDIIYNQRTGEPHEISAVELARSMVRYLDDCKEDAITYYVVDEDSHIASRSLLDEAEDFLSCSGKPVLIQPAVGYHEQLKRMADILPKLINSTCLIDTSYVPPGRS